jgi:Mg-chelatase subunit ChlD
VPIALATGVSVLLALGLRAAIDASLFSTPSGRFLAPEMLFLLTSIPFVVLFAYRSKATLTRSGFVFATALRVLLLALLCIALARPVHTEDATQVAVVALVDVSPSVSDEVLEAAHARVQALRAQASIDSLEVATFARTAAHARGSAGFARITSDVPSTDIGSALGFAETLFPPEHVRRVWLLSDGQETHGSALQAAHALSSRGVRVFATTLEGELAREVAVTQLSFPEELRAGQPFEVRVALASTTSTRARVRLFQDGRLVGLDAVREVELHQGQNEVAFRTVVSERGTVELRAEVETELDGLEADRFHENDVFSRSATVIGRPRVLILSPEPSRIEGFARVLAAAEIDPDVRTPRGIPEALAAFDMVVLANTPVAQVPADAEARIERYVREGGTLLVSGGEHALGPGGWQGTRLARILPVSLEGERRRDTPSLALALVIDRSGSMAGEKMELAKEAARATAEVLSPDDALLVIGFDSVAERFVPLQSAGNRAAIQRDIGRLSPRGGTAIFPALDAAYQDLAASHAANRHVILLTDGQTGESGLPELTAAMRAEGITVTTVGVGADVNRALLSELADLGGGRSYFTTDPSSVPRIFLSEATTMTQNSLVEEYVHAEQVSDVAYLRSITWSQAPLLRGYVATEALPPPSVLLLRTDLGDPLLASRPVDRGTTLVWTSDLEGRYAADFLRWQGSPRLFGQLVRAHREEDEASFLPLEATMEGDDLVLTADALDANDNFLRDVSIHARIEGPLHAPTQTTTELDLLPVAPGRYRARMPLTHFGAYAVQATHALGGVTFGASRANPVFPYPREFASLGPDHAAMRALAEAGNGAVIEASELAMLTEIEASEHVERHREWTPWVLALGLVLLVFDVLVRRFTRA